MEVVHLLQKEEMASHFSILCDEQCVTPGIKDYLLAPLGKQSQDLSQKISFLF